MKEIFVFGSNESGIHGAGAAKAALNKYGALWGHSYGIAGESFAIPTKNRDIKTLPLKNIKAYIQGFKAFAYGTRGIYTFKVTCIGCGLAGYEDSQIAPFFEGSPRNCLFDKRWKPWLGDRYDYFEY